MFQNECCQDRVNVFDEITVFKKSYFKDRKVQDLLGQGHSSAFSTLGNKLSMIPESHQTGCWWLALCVVRQTPHRRQVGRVPPGALPLRRVRHLGPRAGCLPWERGGDAPTDPSAVSPWTFTATSQSNHKPTTIQSHSNHNPITIQSQSNHKPIINQ